MYNIYIKIEKENLYRVVSQLASEPDCLSGGCGFESHRRDQRTYSAQKAGSK